jgi:uncharacterized sporulation protein YeaH/YhbH (DUF444 family)
MSVIHIDSDESEGFFNDFIDERLDDLVNEILTEGDIERGENDGSDLIIEMDDIFPPTFTYGNQSGQGGGGGIGTGGGDEEKLKFDVPYDRFMQLVAEKLRLPDLTKEGRGKIKSISYTMNTYGTVGIILDKKRTFRRALKTSIGTGNYDPGKGRYNIEIQRKDKRYKIPQRVETPKYKAVVFYVGDISYSTHGERLELEKRLLNFVHQWLDFNYGAGNVEHRFFVHDAKAYEVSAENFYNVGNVGGTTAAPAFELIAKVARNEYNVEETNFYTFYVGDGELYHQDAEDIVSILETELTRVFNRFCITEIKPSHHSILYDVLDEHFDHDRVVRLAKLSQKSEIIATIKTLLGGVYA